MSLNDLLPLLFVAAFVVNAIVRGRQAQKRREASRKRGERPGTPSARGQGPGGRQAREVRADTAPRGDPPGAGGAGRPAQVGRDASDADSQGDDLMRRIEEARRRVREAMGEGGSEATREPASARRDAPAPGGPPAGGLGGGPSPPTPSPGTLGHGSMFTGPRRAPEVPASVPTFLGREGVREPSGPIGDVAPDAPRVARLGKPAGSARLRAAHGLGSNRDDIVRGFVWSVVLQEPVAVRMRRRSVSPRRSP